MDGFSGNAAIEMLQDVAQERQLTEGEAAHLRRAQRAEWIMSHRDPRKHVPARFLGTEPRLDLVERFCLLEPCPF